MDQLLKLQNAQDGSDNMSMEKLEKAFGGILSFLKSKVPGFDINKIQDVVPQAKDLISNAEKTHGDRAADGNNDLVSSAMGMLSSFAGGGDKAETPATTSEAGSAAVPAGSASTTSGQSAPIDSMTELMGYLSKAGIDPKQAMSFLPVAAGFLKTHGIDVSSILGVPGGTSSEGTSAAAAPAANAESGKNDAVGNLMNQAQGFLGSFKK
jgi:hypothetical protein